MRNGEEESIKDSINNRFYRNNNNKNSDNEINDDFNEYKSLKEFGYYYNEKGELRSIGKEEKFKFINQKHYDRFGYFVVREIQDIMRNKFNLDEVKLPVEEEFKLSPIKSNIFMSKDFTSNIDTLMVIICGSGAVKAGQWARSLCINDSLNNGTIFPYLENAKDLGFSTIILNPNYNYYERPLELSQSQLNEIDKEIGDIGDSSNGNRISIPFNQTPQSHVLYVFDKFIKDKSPAKNIIIVAHSYGGVLTVDLLEKRKESLENRLELVTLTDSVHSLGSISTSLYTQSIFSNESKTRNWVKSDEPLGKDLGFSRTQGCKIVSAGHPIHEFTSASCKNDLFNFINKYHKSK